MAKDKTSSALNNKGEAENLVIAAQDITVKPSSKKNAVSGDKSASKKTATADKAQPDADQAAKSSSKDQDELNKRKTGPG